MRWQSDVLPGNETDHNLRGSRFSVQSEGEDCGSFGVMLPFLVRRLIRRIGRRRLQRCCAYAHRTNLYLGNVPPLPSILSPSAAIARVTRSVRSGLKDTDV